MVFGALLRNFITVVSFSQTRCISIFEGTKFTHVSGYFDLGAFRKQLGKTALVISMVLLVFGSRKLAVTFSGALGATPIQVKSTTAQETQSVIPDETEGTCATGAARVPDEDA